ncbi:MAG TPA: zf-HC2 domain-containing protein [Actinomycetota bacterium]|nr:zf-HC2 domain-containing protein [Actinomycetota bacterium]
MREYCRTTLELIYLYIDEEILSESERREIRVHLEECGPCYERFGLQRRVTVIVSRQQRHSSCPQELRARITQILFQS